MPDRDGEPQNAACGQALPGLYSMVALHLLARPYRRDIDTDTREGRVMHETRFRAMGTDCHVLVEVGDVAHGQALLDLARTRVELLEQSWSRFRPISELSRLNSRAGTGPIHVSADLLLLGERMQEAWHMTNGLFDPTVLTSMMAMGYNADFATISTIAVPAVTDIGLLPAPGMGGVRVDSEASTISLPAGVGLDPGAIGKGLAADIIASELRDAGARGVLVNLGGDIRLAGQLDEPWCIEVLDERLVPESGVRPLDVLTFDSELEQMGIATSTTLKRRWAEGRHHVIDPRTGAPSARSPVQVTVLANEAWRAEVLATAALLHDDADAWLGQQGIAALIVTSDAVQRTPHMGAQRKEYAHG